jgi:hypothetical protein
MNGQPGRPPEGLPPYMSSGTGRLRRRGTTRPMGRPPLGVFSSRLARRLREEGAHQRAKVFSATLRACGLAPLMLADRERESHLALALIAVVLVTGHGSISPEHQTGERWNLPTDASTRRIHRPRRWASRTWPASLARAGRGEDAERVRSSADLVSSPATIPAPLPRATRLNPVRRWRRAHGKRGAHGIPCAPQRSYPRWSR